MVLVLLNTLHSQRPPQTRKRPLTSPILSSPASPTPNSPAVPNSRCISHIPPNISNWPTTPAPSLNVQMPPVPTPPKPKPSQPLPQTRSPYGPGPCGLGLYRPSPYGLGPYGPGQYGPGPYGPGPCGLGHYASLWANFPPRFLLRPRSKAIYVSSTCISYTYDVYIIINMYIYILHGISPFVAQSQTGLVCVIFEDYRHGLNLVRFLRGHASVKKARDTPDLLLLSVYHFANNQT